MSVALRKDLERVLLSLMVAILIHVVIFLIFPYIIKLGNRELPHYSGPIYVNIEEVPSITTKVTEKRELPEKPVETKPVETKPEITKAEKSKEITASKVSESATANKGIGAIGKTSETPSLQSLVREPAVEKVSKSLSGESIFKSEEASPRYVEKREVNVPLAPSGERKEVKTEKLPVPEENEKENLALGESTYSNLDKLLKKTSTNKATSTSGEAGALSGATTESGKGIDTTGTVGESVENVRIQWEEPSQGRKPIYTPKPRIPKWVSEQGLELEVTAFFVLRPEGIVSSITLERSSGYSDVDSAITEAIRRWRFQPVASERNVFGRITYVIKPQR